MFSKVSGMIRQNGCESIPGKYLYNCICTCYSCIYISDLIEKIHNCSSKPNPKCELLQGVWDFKKWIEPFQGSMEYHSKYHVFRFTKGSTSKVSILN